MKTNYMQKSEDAKAKLKWIDRSPKYYYNKITSR